MAQANKVSRRFSLRVVVLLCAGLFLAGYTVGTFLPFTELDASSFLGSMRRPGDNRHRN